MDGNPVFRDLDTHFQQAADLISHSWKENKDQTLDYNASFLASCYQYPGARMEFSPALYEDGRLRAFVCGFPRHVQLGGKRLRLLLLTFFTVAPERKGAGLGKAIWAEALRRAKAGGFDGAIHYCVDGNKSNLVTVGAAQSIGECSEWVFTVQYLMKLLQRTSPPDAPEESETALTQLFLECADKLRGGLPFARLWSREEADWECRRYGSTVSTAHTGGAAALLTGYVLNSAQGTPCLFTENVLWEDLPPAARVGFLEQFLGQAALKAEVAVVPLWGYFDPGPFEEIGFRRSTRKLHAYLTLWRPSTVPGKFPCMYLDVF